MTVHSNSRVSIIEVAKATNVSIQTVSRVINQQSGVSVQTRERILKAVEELGYFPSRAAKAMRGTSQTLGIVGYGLELYGPSRTLIGAQREASRRNYGVILELVQDPEKVNIGAIFETLLSNHVDGIVWCIPEIGNNIEHVIARRDKLSVPLVFTDKLPTHQDLMVCSDNYLGGYTATRHLIDNGHRTIGLITGPVSYLSARERQRGWQAALQEAGLSVNEQCIAEGDWGSQSGADSLQHLLERYVSMTAVFACNDQMALGVLHCAEQLGLRVPDDLAVVGFDDIPEATFFHPPLSSVRQDVVEMGRRAVDQIIQAIESNLMTGKYEPKLSVITPELVIRASSRKSSGI